MIQEDLVLMYERWVTEIRDLKAEKAALEIELEYYKCEKVRL